MHHTDQHLALTKTSPRRLDSLAHTPRVPLHDITSRLNILLNANVLKRHDRLSPISPKHARKKKKPNTPPSIGPTPDHAADIVVVKEQTPAKKTPRLNLRVDTSEVSFESYQIMSPDTPTYPQEIVKLTGMKIAHLLRAARNYDPEINQTLALMDRLKEIWVTELIPVMLTNNIKALKAILRKFPALTQQYFPLEEEIEKYPIFCTLLHFAAQESSPAIVQFLINNGADSSTTVQWPLNFISTPNITPLYYAQHRKDTAKEEIIAILTN